jgi:hypothetical protein
VKTRLTLAVLGTILACALCALPQPASASPFGWGKFGANVPFGSATSLSISLGGNVALNLTANGATFTGTGSHTVTVTSTDVVGYMLYAHTTGSSNLANGSATIAASSNSTAGPLATGTWGSIPLATRRTFWVWPAQTHCSRMLVVPLRVVMPRP